ncbi:MAG: hypothetical protein H7Y36_07370 [Armatimonadetes bacterium]|nr:hypothetical protein [Akkermansiaceae bacterium]
MEGFLPVSPGATTAHISSSTLLRATTSATSNFLRQWIGASAAIPRIWRRFSDWLCKNGSFIDLQRLKTLHATTGLGDPGVLAAVADWLVTQARQPKWRAISIVKSGEAELRNLFGGKTPQSPHPVFLRHEILREKVSCEA